jgi:hypothetical protein
VQPVSPSSIAAGPKNWLLVAEPLKHRIAAFGPEGKLRRSWSVPAAPGCSAAMPIDVCLRPDGRLAVADAAGRCATVLDPDGKVPPLFLGRPETGPGLFGQVERVGTDERNNVYVYDPSAGRLSVFSPRGELTGSWNGRYLRRAVARVGHLFWLDSFPGRGLWLMRAPQGGGLSPRCEAYYPLGERRAGRELLGGEVLGCDDVDRYCIALHGRDASGARWVEVVLVGQKGRVDASVLSRIEPDELLEQPLRPLAMRANGTVYRLALAASEARIHRLEPGLAGLRPPGQ